ncbi:MAG TPA: hypothetical protein VFC44_10040 [Candidatus Saccharimonadales bacterium]|nr:hypothetical protein [Candidatus Saccharimonadales bacterium]
MKPKQTLLQRICITALAIGAAAIAIALAPMATRAQTITVWTDDFQDATLFSSNSIDGTYGTVSWNFSGAGIGNPMVIITNDLPPTNGTQNCAFTFVTSPTNGALNFGWATDFLPATNNTSVNPAAYTLEFDMAVQGISLTNLGGYVGPVLGLFGNYGGQYNGDGAEIVPSAAYFPGAGTGYQHYSIPFTNFASANANLLPPTDSPLAFFIGFYIPAATNYGTVEIDLANIQVLMNTNTAPPPLPTLTILPATPELRLFAQNSAATYNEEGFLSVDQNQSWIGSVAGHPSTYSFTYKDWNTVPGFMNVISFMPNNYMQNGGPASSPYTVYYASNALQLTITKETSSFVASLDWRTNAPILNSTNNILLLTNSTGIGTWILKFTDDTDGTLTPPGGSPVAFTLPAAMAAQFANPLTIFSGIAPNSTAGYGQYIDMSGISITNVAGVNEQDDFTKDASLNAYWDLGFSVDAGSVVQVSTNTPFWLTWTLPDAGYGLETKNSLNDAVTPWYSPAAWNGVTPVTTKMGFSMKWTLMPIECLPYNLNDGSFDQGYFRLSNPPPTQ